MVGITTNMLAYYVMVVELRSAKAAAERMHIAQSGICKSMNELEKKLGVPLFFRSVTGFRTARLTDAGKQFYDYAKATLAGLERFMENNQGKKVTR